MEVFTIVSVLSLQFAQVDCFVTVGTIAAQVQGKVQQLAVHRVTLKSQAGAIIIPDEGTSSQALRFPVPAWASVEALTALLLPLLEDDDSNHRQHHEAHE